MPTISCAKCAAHLDAGVLGCPRCGANPRTGESLRPPFWVLASFKRRDPTALSSEPAWFGLVFALGSCGLLFLAMVEVMDTYMPPFMVYTPPTLEWSWMLFLPALVLGSLAAVRGFRARGKGGVRRAALNRVFGLLTLALLVPVVTAPLWWPSGPHINDSAVKEGIHTIQIGIETYAVDHDDRFPPPSMVDARHFGEYVERWPTTERWGGEPLRAGDGPGEFEYRVNADCTAYRLVGYGADGEIALEVGCADDGETFVDGPGVGE